MSSAGGAPTTVADHEAEIYRIVRRRTPLLLLGAFVQVLTVFAIAFIATFVHANSVDVAALRAQDEALKQRQEQQAAAFDVFITHFVQQQNYVCMIAAAYAKRTNLPPPPDHACAVTLPSLASATPTAAASRCAHPTPSPRAAATPGETARVTPRSSPQPSARATPTPLLCLPVLCISPLPVAAAC